MIAVIRIHPHPPVTRRTVDHDHGGVRNPSLQKSLPPKSHHHGGGEVKAVIQMTPRTVGGRNHRQRSHPHRHERIRRGRRVAVGGVTARTVVEVAAAAAAVEALMTPGPADEKPKKRPPLVRNLPPSHRHHASQLRNPRLKSTTPAMPIRECAPSTPTFVYGESHVWGDGRMFYGSVPRVSRRRKRRRQRRLVIMRVVPVG
mmetsp:Transcript_19769/g.32419  ORF Transcript_19769/g.32419 Transcript_19769/m.32419 type:complete len:201 (+) Transcript_19769:1096-1698(+)